MSSHYKKHGSSQPESGPSSRTGTGNPRASRPSTASSRRPGGSTSSQDSGSTSLAGSGIILGPGGNHPMSRPTSGTAPVHSNVNMRPGGGRPPGGSTRGSNSASLQEVDLNVSAGSEQSVVTLGGIEYPVGSRIGKTGMFVIGNPEDYPKHNTSNMSFRSSALSTDASQGPMYRGDGKGYSFEYWNWGAIRFACFIIICLQMVGLLAGVITVGIQHKQACTAHFLWWQGSTFYRLPVPYFYDTDNSKFGDLNGIEKKHGYLEYMGHGAVILQDFLWSEPQDFELVTSFTEIDPRFGLTSRVQDLVDILHDRDIRLVLQFCPWYTSKEHPWYIESRESSTFSASQFKDFYVWSDAPDLNSKGKWEFNPIRNQYYLHWDNPQKPLLDWTNQDVINTFEGILNYWLNLRVDGFLICGLEHFYVNNSTDLLSILGQYHAVLNDKSQGDDSQKILIVDNNYIQNITRTMSPTSQMVYRDLLERIDLIDTPLYLDPQNKTAGLQAYIQSHLKHQDVPELESQPWILWSLSKLKDLPALNLGAIQLLNLMLPGTPSYTAGQEIGQFYLERDDRYQAPMLWQNEGVLPYNPGGPLELYNMEGLHNVSTLRKSTFSLRFDRQPVTEDQQINIQFLEVDPELDFMLFSRFYPSDNTYYYAVNFGVRDIKKDFAKDITPWATVLADSSNIYQGRLELGEVTLEAGQAIIFYPTK